MPSVLVSIPPATIQAAQAHLNGARDPAGVITDPIVADCPEIGGTVTVRYLPGEQPDTIHVTAKVETASGHVEDGRILTAAEGALAAIPVAAPDGRVEVLPVTSEVTLTVPAAQADWLAGLLEGEIDENVKSGTKLWGDTVVFGGGYEADISVIAADDEAPYVDAALFLNGTDVDGLEAGETLFEDHGLSHDGRDFLVTVVRGRDDRTARPAPRPRRPSANATWL
jgi:hypothetical protein